LLAQAVELVCPLRRTWVQICHGQASGKHTLQWVSARDQVANIGTKNIPEFETDVIFNFH